MMKPIVFAGPSLTAADKAAFPDIRFVAPAMQGDVLRVISRRPPAIGIIDGFFGDCLAVHQKEILEAMAEGIPVVGGASMGALRAAELHGFGMRGVGVVFRAYVNGVIESDADVAVAHGPAELDFVATSISMIDVRATIAAIRRRRLVSDDILEQVLSAAASIHFTERSWEGIERKVRQSASKRSRLKSILRKSAVQQKRLDAIEVVQTLNEPPHGVSEGCTAPPMTSYYKTIRERAFASGNS